MTKPPTPFTILERLDHVVSEFKEYLDDSVKTSDGIIDYDLALEDGLRYHIQEFVDKEETKLQAFRDQLDQAKDYYKEYLPTSKNRFPPKYMTDNPEIMKMFRRTRFVDVITYLLQITSNLDSTRALQEHIPYKKRKIPEIVLSGKNMGKSELRELILLSIDFVHAMEKLQMSVVVVGLK